MHSLHLGGGKKAAAAARKQMEGNEFVVFQFNTNMVLREICLFAYPIRLMGSGDIAPFGSAHIAIHRTKGYRLKSTHKFGSLISRNRVETKKKIKINKTKGRMRRQPPVFLFLRVHVHHAAAHN